MRFKELLPDERGAEMTEYILIVALISIAAIVALAFFREKIVLAFKTLGERIQTAVGE